MTILAIDHIQLAIPSGGEDAARAFYGGLLGIPEVPKPVALAARGGCWFERGSLRVHLGVDPEFRAARQAHPAFVVDDLAVLSAALTAAGHPVTVDFLLPDRTRAFVADPFGNRIELIQTTA